MSNEEISSKKEVQENTDKTEEFGPNISEFTVVSEDSNVSFNESKIGKDVLEVESEKDKIDNESFEKNKGIVDTKNVGDNEKFQIRDDTSNENILQSKIETGKKEFIDNKSKEEGILEIVKHIEYKDSESNIMQAEKETSGTKKVRENESQKTSVEIEKLDFMHSEGGHSRKCLNVNYDVLKSDECISSSENMKTEECESKSEEESFKMQSFNSKIENDDVERKSQSKESDLQDEETISENDSVLRNFVIKDSDRIKNMWEYFFKADIGTYEKTKWLDVLLSEFLIQYKNGTDVRSSVERFCSVSALTTLICCELLGGIHAVVKNCSMASSEYEPPEDIMYGSQIPSINVPSNVSSGERDNMALSQHIFQQFSNTDMLQHKNELMKKYILKGMAWKILAVTQALGVIGLSCNRHLCGFLIWLCEGLNGLNCNCKITNPHIRPLNPKEPLFDLMTKRIWEYEVKTLFKKSKSKLRKRLLKRSLETSRNREKLKVKRVIKTVSNRFENVASSDSQKDSELEQLNKSLLLKPNNLNEDSDMPCDDEFGMHSKTRIQNDSKPSVEDFLTDHHKIVSSSEISIYELHTIAIDLLYKFCEAENATFGPQNLHVSYQCANFALKQLCALQFRTSLILNSNISLVQILHLKVMLIELLIKSIDKVLTNHELKPRTIVMNIFPILLKLMIDLKKFNVNIMSFSTDEERLNMAKYIFGLNYVTLIVLYNLLIQKKNVTDVFDFNTLILQLSDGTGTLPFYKSIILLVKLSKGNESVTKMIRKLLDFIKRFVSTIKRLRTVFYHRANCCHSPQKKCVYVMTKMIHHHKDVFGKSYDFRERREPATTCVASMFFSVYVYLLINEGFSRDTCLKTKILKCMINCGYCCCFSPRVLLDNFIYFILKNPNISQFCFLVLESTLYTGLGATKLYASSADEQCKICVDIFTMYENDREDNVFWPFLSKYNLLLQSENTFLVHSTMVHMLRVSSMCNATIKHDILFCVLLPAFTSAITSYIEKSDEKDFFIATSCLKMFSNLLRAISVMDEFVEKGGLTNVLEVMYLPEFSKYCCSILEIAIDVEIFKTQYKFYSEIYIGSPGVSSMTETIKILPSLTLLVDCLNDSSAKVFDYFNSKMDKNIIANLCDLKCENYEFLFGENSEESEGAVYTYDVTRRKSNPIDIKRKTVSNMEQAKNAASSLEILNMAYNFWNTCSDVCLYCPIFRKYLVCQPVFKDSYKLLRLVLHSIYHVSSSLEENDVLIKILKSLIIVGFSLSDCTMNQSKILTINYLNEVLSSDFSIVETASLKTLLEMMVEVSSVYINKIQIMPNSSETKLPEHLIKNEDVESASSEDEEEDKYIYPFLQEDSDFYFTADEGYEADIESNVFEKKSKSKHLFAESQDKDLIKNLKRESIMSDQKNNLLIHPEMCNIIINILMQLIDRIVKAYQIPESEPDTSIPVLSTLVCSCINRLASIFSLENNCIAANGLISFILKNPVAEFLKVTSPKLEELQRSLLNLVHAIATHFITPSELKLYLSYFSHSRVPINIILEPLLKLTTSLNYNSPDFIIYFPTKKTINSTDEILDINKELASLKDSTMSAAEKVAKTFELYHHDKLIRSCWAYSSFWTAIEKTGWSIWITGFTATMWLKLDRFAKQQNVTSNLSKNSSSEESDKTNSLNRQYKDKIKSRRKLIEPLLQTESDVNYMLHLFSIGQDVFMLEFWCDANNGNLQIRVCQPKNEMNVIFGTKMINKFLPLCKWCHLTAEVKDFIPGDNTSFTIILYIDGILTDTINMTINGNMARKVKPIYFLMGHSTFKYDERVEQAGSWSLSEFTLFRAPLLNRHSPIHLLAKGPNNSSFLTCLIGKEVPNYSRALTKDSIITDSLIWDLMYHPSPNTIQHLVDNLFLRYSPSNPLITEFYHLTGVTTKQFSHKKNVASKTITSAIPSSLPCMWMSTPLVNQYKGLPITVYLSGGPHILLLLFAKVVEYDGTAEEQAAALRILLKVCFSNCKLYSEFYQEDIMSLLQPIFSSPKCHMSHHLLKVILDEVCNESILVNINSKFHLLIRDDFVIHKPDLLITLLQSWRELERNKNVVKKSSEDQNKKINILDRMTENSDIVIEDEGLLMETFLLALQVMIRQNSTYRDFNIFQLERVNMVDNLLLFCKEKFLNSETNTANTRIHYYLVELISSLHGVTCDHNQIPKILDFLILMHQANLTFITHSKSDFYFNILRPQFGNSNEEAGKIRLSFTGKTKKNTKGKGKAVIISRQSSPKRTKTETESTYESSEVDTVQQSDDKSSNDNKNVKEDINMPSTSKSTPGTSRDMSGLTKDYVIIDQSENTTYRELNSPVLLHRLTTESKSGWIICEGLLRVIFESINNQRTYVVKRIFDSMINFDVLLILSNHKDASIRTMIVKILSVFVRHHSNSELKNLSELNLFIHLANQISLYPATESLVTSTLSLFFREELPFLDYLKFEKWFNISDFDLNLCIPTLALLPCTFHDAVLFNNLSKIFMYIIKKTDFKKLQDLAICEIVLKCLKSLGSLDKKSVEGYDSIFEDCIFILKQVVFKTLAHNPNHQILIDLHNQLLYFNFSDKFPIKDSVNLRVYRIMRKTLSILIDMEFDFINEKLQNSGSEIRSSNVLSYDTNFFKFSDNSRRKSLYNEKREMQTIRADLVSRQYVQVEASNTEMKIVHKTFTFLLNDIAASNQRVRNRWWSGIMGLNVENAFVDMFYFIICPLSFPKMFQKNILKEVYISSIAIRSVLTPSDPLEQRKLGVCLKALRDDNQNIDESFHHSLQLYIDKWMSELQFVGNLSFVTDLTEETKLLAKVLNEKYEKTRNFSYIEKSMFNKEPLMTTLIEQAMTVTRKVVEIQNNERKSFLEYIRNRQNDLADLNQKWRIIIENHCHENGVWSTEAFCSNAWELNPTEGPDRIRLLLRRSRMDINQKFFRKNSRNKTDGTTVSAPLAYLFESLYRHAHGGLVERLHLNENITFMCRIVYVNVKYEQEGELLLSDRCIHFLPDNGNTDQSLMSAFWPLITITKVVTRRWQLKETAVEIFLSSGHAHLLAFKTSSEMKSFLASINTCHLPNRLEIDSLNESMNLWRNGILTNWAYLMELNGLAGRTYNDLMQYPILPFILSDYTSNHLNLTNPACFRNLHKPMAVQSKEKEDHYINNYAYLQQIRLENPLMFGIGNEPYHYGSHYSNSGTILHFLVRLPPYTKLFLNYQDNNFDIPDRTFHSIQTTWRLSSSDSTTDVKELIPEFFYLPHFLYNHEGLEFGVRQCGEVVDDVNLPPWAPNARLFILIHRQALESVFVRENLPNWIDLVFGYKQTGQAAVDAINVFHPATYYGFDTSVITDDIIKSAWETMVRTYGQTPRQLLKQPHPQCITDLQHIPIETMPVLRSVSGLRWGNYCGSPEQPDPVNTWRQQRSIPVVRLMSLANGDVIGAPNFSTMMLIYNRNKESATGIPSLSIIGIVTWGHPDGIIRIKRQKDLPPSSLIKIHSVDSLCVVANGFGTTFSTLWLGLLSGRIIVVKVIPDDEPPNFYFSRKPSYLYGHNAPIVDISVCTPFNVAASASSDGVINIWDAHNFTHIRSINNKLNTVSLVCISETMCDVASVHLKEYEMILKSQSSSASTSSSNSNPSSPEISNKPKIIKYKSKLRINTINGLFVGEVRIVEKITSVCYSNAVEGRTVNALAVGLESGTIKLYSSWDLTPIRSLIPTIPTCSIISLVYNNNGQQLVGSTSDGFIILWECPNKTGKTMIYRDIVKISLP